MNPDLNSRASAVAGAVQRVSDLDLAGTRVFMRADLNVPLKDGVITSDARIQAALPTIKHALSNKASVVLASHLGRPKGKRVPEMSLEPVGNRLSELLDADVLFADDCVGDGVRGLVSGLREGSVLLLENLRFHKGETDNTPAFAKGLAAAFDEHRDAYINDAFGASHRAHASIVGMVGGFRHRAAGLLLDREIAALSKLLHEPAQPFVAVVGGAKVTDKLGVLESLLSRVQVLCIGGAMAYTFLAAEGRMTGTSRVEDKMLSSARTLLERARARKVEVILPRDHIVADAFAEDADRQLVAGPDIPKGRMGLDIGPETRDRIVAAVNDAGSVFWNGPMGVFEWESFAEGTRAVAAAVAKCEGYTVVGGGDSVAAIEVAGVADQISHVSTGGGASLELLQYETLPGVEALRAPKN